MTSWEERLRLILAIVDKDRRIPLWAWLLTFFIAAIAFFLTLPGAISTAYYASRFGFGWKWYEANLRTFYAISTMLTSLTLGLAFASFHQGEIRRGTIRSIILYPVDMNDITIAKLLSSLIVAAILSSILFFGFFGSFFLLAGYPVADFVAIHFTALAASFVALSAGVFLAQALALVAGRMVIPQAALGAIFLLLAVILTETALNTIGTQIAYIMTPPGTAVSPETLRAVADIARGLSIFSPHHVGARILGISFGLTRMWADFHLVVPVAALIVAGGYWFGKRLYLDVFIR
jgi:ABC-type transport system involved in multi-copper enzyme maturation permease subunit